MSTITLRNWIKSLGQKLLSSGSRRPRRLRSGAENRRATIKPMIEALEDRLTPNNSYLVMNLSNSASTSGSFPWAVAQVDADSTDTGTNIDSITFASSLNGHTITLAGTLSINVNITITGLGAANLAISGGNAVEVFDIASGVTASISSLTVENGKVTGSHGQGGGIFNAGTLTVNNATFSGNTAAGSGGGIVNWISLTLSNSTISGNSAGDGGGGIANGGTLTVTNTTVSGNSAPGGGGIENSNLLTISNSTVSGNTASGGSDGGGGIFNNGGVIGLSTSVLCGNAASYGGGLYNYFGSAMVSDTTFSDNTAYNHGGGIYIYSDYDGINNGNSVVTLDNSTLSGNFASVYGGGIFNYSASVTLQNSVLAGNTANAAPDVYNYEQGSFSANYSMIGNTTDSGLSGGTGNVLNPAYLGRSALGNYGGPTQTIALLPGSPAIGAGDPSQAGTTSQNGVSRPAAPDIGAYQHVSNFNWIVTDPDGNAGSGSPTDVTLPYAVAHALNGDSIIFASSLSGDTITLNGTLTIDSNITITGLGAASLAVSGNNTVGVFSIASGATASISSLTVENGKTTESGGGVYNAGTLTLSSDTVSDNSALDGGGIANDYGTMTLTNDIVSGDSANGGGGINNYDGTMTLTDDTLSGNSASYGGGFLNYGTVTLANATVSGNTSGPVGGGLDNHGSATVTNCTISGNSSSTGGGMYNASGTVTALNTIVAGNSASSGPDVYGTFASNGYNLIGKTDSSSGWVISDLTGTSADPLDPDLSFLGDYGGPTQTIALLPGSPAIDAGGNSGAPSTDQRGEPRPGFGGTVDIGAFESQGFTLSVVSGNNQSANVSTAFNPLAVSVTANNPAEPVNGGEVTFAVTLAGNGAGASLATSPATISSGQASVAPTANGTAGTYTVTASVRGASSVAFGLTNFLPVSSVVVNGDVAPIVDISSNGMNTVTATTDGNNGFTAGDTVVIFGYTGANAGYNGTFTIGTASGDTFTVTNTTAGLPTLTFNNQGLAISLNSTSGLLGNQRSMVDSVAYSFSAPVSGLTAADFTLTTSQPTTDGIAVAPLPATKVPGMTLTSLAGGSIWVVTWVSGGGTGATVVGHSLADGVYDLTLANSGRATDTFYRLYGNMVGYSANSAAVNSSDSLQFSHSYLETTGASTYLAGCDYSAVGVVNSSDSLQLSHRYLSVWSGFTPTI